MASFFFFFFFLLLFFLLHVNVLPEVDFINVLSQKNSTLLGQIANGEWCMSNGAQIRRILGHKFGKFSCAVLSRMLVKLKSEFFQTLCTGFFSLGEKVW
jgi:hypothetical protein